jgi:hypothetical protein
MKGDSMKGKIMTRWEKIIGTLKSLRKNKEVKVYLSPGKKTACINHQREQALDFKFRWIDKNHFTGYFLDSKGKRSQAVLALWSQLDAVNFVSSYNLLIKLRAGRRLH